jgi:2-aminoethylphosphonate dioxygenase
MQPSSVVNAALVEQYRRDGYLLLRTADHNLVNPQDLQRWTREVKEWPAEKGKWMPYHEVNTSGQRQLMRTEKFVDYHDGFEKLLCGQAIAKILKDISGDVSYQPKTKQPS